MVLLDTDPQATLRQWWEKRTDAPTPLMAAASITELTQTLQQLRQDNFKLAIIDTAGRSSEANRSVIEQADFVLLPVKPSAGDLWAIGATVEACQGARKGFAFAVTQATRGAAMTIQAVAALAQTGPVAPVVVHNRVGFAAAMGLGKAIQEIEPRGPGAGEVTELWSFVQSNLHGHEQTNKRARRKPSVAA